MLARTGTVMIWHWAHIKDNPHCKAARESEWHIAWKDRGIDDTQEITVGRRRADILAPGGFAVDFQSSALDSIKVWAREADWAVQGGLVWVFRADEAFMAGRITTSNSLAGYENYLSNPERRETLNITWSHAPERVRSAEAPAFLDIGLGELLFIGGWRHGSSPLTGYGWRVPIDAVVRNVLRGTAIPAPITGDPAEIVRMIEAWQRQEAKKKARRRREERHREAERQREEWRRQEAERQREEEERQRQEQRREVIRARQQAMQQAASRAEAPSPSGEEPPRRPERLITQKLRNWRLRREARRDQRLRQWDTLSACSRLTSPGAADPSHTLAGIPAHLAVQDDPRPLSTSRAVWDHGVWPRSAGSAGTHRVQRGARPPISRAG
jgi:hypothetical protein